MFNQNRRLAVLSFTLTALTVCTAQAVPITGGNAVIDRPNTDTALNFVLLDRNNLVSGTGNLTSWQVFAGAGLQQVQLLIYRATGVNTYALIGSSAAEFPVAGLNTFTLTTPIATQAGDAVGLYFSSAGSVDFTLDGPGGFALGNLSGKVLFTTGGGLANATAFTDSSNRTYSVSVAGDTGGSLVPEPASLALAGIGLLGFMALSRRRRRS